MIKDIWAKTPAKVSTRKHKEYVPPVFTLEDLVPGKVVFFDPYYSNFLFNSNGQAIWCWQGNDPLNGRLTGVGAYNNVNLTTELTQICEDFIHCNLQDLTN